MLVELIVENFALVEQARIRFHEGLNLLTGETGSGKSIVVDSLGLLLGARASAEMVRTGESRARISGIFSVDETAEIKDALASSGIDFDSEEDLIVEREVTANGKSRAFVASRPVTSGFLRQLAPLLGDIHGQGEQQLLFSSQAQRGMVDRYARTGAAVDQVGKIFNERTEVEEKLADLSRDDQEKLRLLDLWTFQRREIEETAPTAGEDAELETERRVLGNVTKLEESITAAYSALYEAPDSVVSQMKTAQKRIEEASRIDESLNSASAMIQESEVAIEEAARTLRDYLSKLEGDPGRLEEVETRLAGLDKLKRKYGGSVDAVIEFLNDIRQKIDEVENSSEHRALLEKKLEALNADYFKTASELTEKRNGAAGKLARLVETELKSLAMGNTAFRIHVRPSAWTAQGMDEIEFLVSANRGEEAKPLEKVASGGEVSRIALALKTAMGDADARGRLHTLVFDEVDTGVGGAAAASVGKRLKLLSKNNQVICVTHLAQIAGFADHHYAVSKREKQNRTATMVKELSQDERAQEIGRMLSGEKITAEALRQAEQLMRAGA